jgi:hypothetical protein
MEEDQQGADNGNAYCNNDSFFVGGYIIFHTHIVS